MTCAPARVQRLAFFGPPPVLEGEDAALYDDLVGRMWAAVNPIDVIDELYAADVVSLEWEILRWRRLKFSLLQASIHNGLEGFFNRWLDYEVYSKAFAEVLTEILQEASQLAQKKAKELAHQYIQSQPDAVKKVEEVLKVAGLHLDNILDQAKAQRAEELVQGYAQREPEAIKLANKLLASRGRTIHDLMLEGSSENFDHIERIDRLITIAETRRNVSLREIDRRHAELGEALRRNVRQVEEGEFEVIEMPAEGKSPA